MDGLIQLQHGLQALEVRGMLGLKIPLNGMTETATVEEIILLGLLLMFVLMMQELQSGQQKVETVGVVSTRTVMVGLT
jgi:hypothetical protein